MDLAFLRQKPFSLKEKDVEWVGTTLAGMDEDEKIGQLFHLITYDADEGRLRELCQRYKPGGVMARIMPAKEAARMSEILSDACRIPPLISANLEAGGDGVVSEGTQVGPNLLIAATGDATMARRAAEVAAKEAGAVGVNCAFAPVVDLDLNFRNPITNTRTFGSGAAFTARAAVETIRGFRANGICAVAKHFPGDGVDERDQHLVTSVNDLNCATWDACYGQVWRACIDAGVMAVMAGHIAAPAWARRFAKDFGVSDKDRAAAYLPATLSAPILRGFLRGHLGFNGLILTDASTMAGFQGAMHRREAVPRSIAAGCDMFLFTRNLEEDYAFMRQGLETGLLTRERLDEAVARILGTKAAIGLHTRTWNGRKEKMKTADAVIGAPEHLKWQKLCAERGVTLVKDRGGVLPIDPIRQKRVLVYLLESGASAFGTGGADLRGMIGEALEREGFEVTYFEPGGGFEGMSEPYEKTVEKYDWILYAANLATRSNQTTVRIEWASPMGANCPQYLAALPTVFVSFANPYHLLDVPRVPVYINAYACRESTVRAVIDRLVGRAPFTGVSPVDAFCGREDTDL